MTPLKEKRRLEVETKGHYATKDRLFWVNPPAIFLFQIINSQYSWPLMAGLNHEKFLGRLHALGFKVEFLVIAATESVPTEKSLLIWFRGSSLYELHFSVPLSPLILAFYGLIGIDIKSSRCCRANENFSIKLCMTPSNETLLRNSRLCKVSSKLSKVLKTSIRAWQLYF